MTRREFFTYTGLVALIGGASGCGGGGEPGVGINQPVPPDAYNRPAPAPPPPPKTSK